ncbi:ABC transporter permease subunit [Paenibacillus rhizoplanae]|uniref:ABC transporter permease n=1 Tax=Paenibacillus rhizoplanae TaxID=1917181 RepID=A0ABW5FLI9_9BACL
MIKRTFTNKQALLGITIIIALTLAAAAAPLLSPHNPNRIDVLHKYLPASSAYPLGTDQLGRCVFSRLLYGARYSLGIAVPMMLLLGGIGIVLGTAAAYIGGKVEQCFLIICDIFMAFPPLVVVMSLVGALGEGISNILLAILFSMWVWFAKIVRTYAGMEMSKDYITASRIAGCSDARIIFHHVIPNIFPQFIVYLSTGIASLILMVSSFSFLGLGFPAGTPEWGAMLSEARSSVYSHPLLLLYPGLCVLLAAAGFNLFGEALRDITTPEGAGE